jgi:hypothetical protein
MEISIDLNVPEQLNKEVDALIDQISKQLQDPEYIDEIARHEATHALYARKFGYEAEFNGPSIRYCMEGKKLVHNPASVSVPTTLYEDVAMLDIAKMLVAPSIVAAHLRPDTYRPQSKGDARLLRDWYNRRHPGQSEEQIEDGINRLVEKAADAVLTDLENEDFLTELSDLANECETTIFDRTER